jgi:hypothetical protein
MLRAYQKSSKYHFFDLTWPGSWTLDLSSIRISALIWIMMKNYLVINKVSNLFPMYDRWFSWSWMDIMFLRFCHHLQILTSDLFSNRCATRELLVITTTNEFFIPTRHTTTTDTTTTDTTKPIETDVRCSIALIWIMMKNYLVINKVSNLFPMYDRWFSWSWMDIMFWNRNLRWNLLYW